VARVAGERQAVRRRGLPRWLAMRISPSRVSSSTVPISRINMRTGSVVRPSSASSRPARGGLFDRLLIAGEAGSEAGATGIRCLLVHGMPMS